VALNNEIVVVEHNSQAMLEMIGSDMAARPELKFGIWERLGVIALIVGVAGVVASLTLPPAVQDQLAHSGLGPILFWGSLAIIFLAVLFFVCDFALFVLTRMGIAIGMALAIIGTTLIIVGAVVGLVGAFRTDSPTKGSEHDTPWVYAVSQTQNNEIARIVAAVGARGKARQHNVDFQFIAITTDKPRKGAGKMFAALLDPGSQTTNFELEPGDYFITMRSDAGMFRESLKITLENNQLRQHIRILNEEDTVIYEATMP